MLETKCRQCRQKLYKTKEFKSRHCVDCNSAQEIDAKMKAAEEIPASDETNRYLQNLMDVSQTMPDRSYDKDRGTPGFLMGEPSPGRSF